MAVGNDTLTTLANILKTKYDQKKVHQMAYEDDPFLALIRKDTKFGGNDARISLPYGGPQGGSVDISQAFANVTSTLAAGFVLTRAHDHQVCKMDSEAMLAGEGSENTVLNTLDLAMRGGMDSIRRSLEIGVYGDGTGTRGKIDSTVTGTTLTLSVPSQIVNFEVGMSIQFANPTGPALRDSGEKLLITAMDEDAGSMTVSPSLSTISGLTAGDLIVRAGDLSGVIKGLAAWIPLAAPSSTLFFGVDRTVAPSRLAGVRWPASGAQKVETLVKANIRLSRSPGAKEKKRIALLNIEDHGDIAIGLGAKSEYDPVKSEDGVFGFSALRINTPRGNLPTMGSIQVPKGEFYILQTDTWVLKSIKGCPHIVEDDGRTLVREASTDAVNWRLRYYAQLGCENPAANLHGAF